MVAGKNLFFTIIYTSYLIICASLKEIRLIVNEELMPQDLGDVRTDRRVQLYMPPTSWGHKNLHQQQIISYQSYFLYLQIAVQRNASSLPLFSARASVLPRIFSSLD
jgi:hypothetical protein